MLIWLCQLPAVKDVLEIPSPGCSAFPSFASELTHCQWFPSYDNLWMLALLKLKCLSAFLCWILTDPLLSPTTGLWQVPPVVQLCNGSHLLTAAVRHDRSQQIRDSNVETNVENSMKIQKAKTFLTFVLWTASLKGQQDLPGSPPKCQWGET